MIILGLTGSIAMGKSFAARLFRRAHIPVFDADKAVHGLLAKGGAAVGKVAALFPASYVSGAIDRKLLGQIVFNNSQALHVLEKILHPLVRKAEMQFIKQSRRKGMPLVVLEIPLLFEVKAQKRCHKVITLSAPAFLQQRRALKRPGMTKAKLASIIKRQVSDATKRRQTDYLVYTGLGKAVTMRQIKTIIAKKNHA